MIALALSMYIFYARLFTLLAHWNSVNSNPMYAPSYACPPCPRPCPALPPLKEISRAAHASHVGQLSHNTKWNTGQGAGPQGQCCVNGKFIGMASQGSRKEDGHPAYTFWVYDTLHRQICIKYCLDTDMYTSIYSQCTSKKTEENHVGYCKIL